MERREGTGTTNGGPPPGDHLTDETLVGRIARNGPAYARLLVRALRSGVPPAQILRVPWPFLLRDAATPPVVTVEFTNECNLRCVYCDNPLRLMPRGFMDRATFSRVLEDVRAMGSVVRVVGNGECTLHPDFGDMVHALAGAARHLFVLTNGNWNRPSVADDLLHADIVGFSIDAGAAEEYERTRVGGSFDRLTANVRMLNERRRARCRASAIIVRVMLRPSQRPREKEHLDRWRPHASAVFRQYVYRMPGVADSGDVFVQRDCRADFLPRCGAPFKELNVDWNGNVPLCCGSARQVGAPGHIVGNVNRDTLADLWNGPVMRQYRAGHRAADPEKTPICRGCTARY